MKNPNKATNEQVDIAVTEAISMGVNTAARIIDKVFSGDTSVEAMRSVDRALQRLKRSGKIKYNGGRIWSLT